MQSRLGSLIEVVVNTIIGFVISFAANLVILPMFGHGSPSMANNLGMTAVFTVLSLLRSYVLRRWFNARITEASNRAAARLSKESNANN
jgi:hypothetical protein